MLWVYLFLFPIACYTTETSVGANSVVPVESVESMPEWQVCTKD